MVRALIDGHKTQTRRLAWSLRDVGDNHTSVPTSWQSVKPGDRLWVRENFTRNKFVEGGLIYTADVVGKVHGRITPCIHMPRSLSRLTLVVVATKIEPLLQITEADAGAEGIVRIDRSLRRHGRLDGYGPPGTPPAAACSTRRNAFGALWCRLHGSQSWDDNPEVVVISFNVHRTNIDAMEKAA